MKPIVGYEGLYSATKSGHIWSHRSSRNMKPCLSVGRTGEEKYERLGLVKDKKRRPLFVHRLVAQAFIPNPKGKPFVNHKNGNKRDNRPENLEWVTQSENQVHAYKEGLQKPNNGVKFCNNTSGYVGVTRCGNKWKAQIRFGGELNYLGVYETPIEASEVYQSVLAEGTIKSIGDARGRSK